MRITKERGTTTPAQLRKAALGLPEVEEETHSGMVAFSARSNEFVLLTDDGHVQLQLLDEYAEAALEDHQSAERLERRGEPIGIRVPLADLNGQALNYLVRRASYARAPKRLADSLAAADSAEPGEVGDLPRSIGRPATQALAGAGITSLAEVANGSQKELSTLHGVGPKAVRILIDALDERGLTLRSDPDRRCSFKSHHSIHRGHLSEVAGSADTGGTRAFRGLRPPYAVSRTLGMREAACREPLSRPENTACSSQPGGFRSAPVDSRRVPFGGERPKEEAKDTPCASA